MADEKPIALVDLDGSLADYHKSMQEKLDALRYPGEPELVPGEKEPAWMKARRHLIKNSPGFWSSLEPIEHGFKIVKEIQAADFDLHVLTRAPKKAPNAWSEKYIWCKQYLPDIDVTITRNKALVHARVLYDDWPPYAEAWLADKPKGYVIMLHQPWNAHFMHSRVYRVVPEHFEKQLPTLRNFLKALRHQQDVL